MRFTILIVMFSKILKYVGIAILALLLTGAIAYGVFAWRFDRKVNKPYAVNVRNIPIPTDSATLAYGRHLYEIKGCGECHGANLGGRVVINDPAIGKITGTNLTYGKNGLPSSFDNEAWLKALRHGLNTENKPLLLMPSQDYYKLDDHDMAAIIAYCKSLPYIDSLAAPNEVGPLGKILTVLGKIDMVPAETIDHGYKQPEKVQTAASAAYGQYLVASCTGCHKPALTGGDNPVPGGVPVANITSKGNVGKWSKEDFIKTLRTGNTPEGKVLRNEDMPWKMTEKYTDVELEALYLYLKSI